MINLLYIYIHITLATNSFMVLFGECLVQKVELLKGINRGNIVRYPHLQLPAVGRWVRKFQQLSCKDGRFILPRLIVWNPTTSIWDSVKPKRSILPRSILHWIVFDVWPSVEMLTSTSQWDPSTIVFGKSFFEQLAQSKKHYFTVSALWCAQCKTCRNAAWPCLLGKALRNATKHSCYGKCRYQWSMKTCWQHCVMNGGWWVDTAVVSTAVLEVNSAPLALKSLEADGRLWLPLIWN